MNRDVTQIFMFILGKIKKKYTTNNTVGQILFLFCANELQVQV